MIFLPRSGLNIPQIYQVGSKKPERDKDFLSSKSSLTSCVKLYLLVDIHVTLLKILPSLPAAHTQSETQTFAMASRPLVTLPFPAPAPAPCPWSPQHAEPSLPTTPPMLWPLSSLDTTLPKSTFLDYFKPVPLPLGSVSHPACFSCGFIIICNHIVIFVELVGFSGL